MSSISRFVDKSKDELKVRPILPFGAPIRLGAIGVVEADSFSPRGNVQSLLGRDVGDVSTGETANWQLTSGTDVQLNFLADGQASTLFPNAPTANAKVEIAFGSADSFLLSVNGLKVSTMTNPAELLTLMLDAYRRGVWQEHHILVYEVIEPQNSLVLLSKSSQSKFLLSAKATVQVPQGSADLAGNFGLTYQNKDAVHLDATAQPLFFNAFRVNRDFWTGDGTVAPFGADDLTAGGIFERV